MTSLAGVDAVTRPSREFVWGLVRAFVAPVLVLLPTWGAPSLADKRFHIYFFGETYSEYPGRLLTDRVSEVGQFLDAGNFRPVGRLVEHTLHLFAYQLSVLMGVPSHIAMAAVSSACVGLLGVGLFVALTCLTSNEPVAAGNPPLVALIGSVAFPAILIASGPMSSIVVFPVC